MTAPAVGDKRPAMARLRRLIGSHPSAAALILVAALLLRVAVPAGFMPDVSSGRIAIRLCTGYGPAAMAMAGKHHGGHDQDKHRKADMPCGFAGLSAPGLAGTDPILPVAALVFAFAVASFEATPLLIVRAPYLRPPLRGPPATL